MAQWSYMVDPFGIQFRCNGHRVMHTTFDMSPEQAKAVVDALQALEPKPKFYLENPAGSYKRIRFTDSSELYMTLGPTWSNVEAEQVLAKVNRGERVI